jgi:hypothetical protein
MISTFDSIACVPCRRQHNYVPSVGRRGHTTVNVLTWTHWQPEQKWPVTGLIDKLLTLKGRCSRNLKLASLIWAADILSLKNMSRRIQKTLQEKPSPAHIFQALFPSVEHFHDLEVILSKVEQGTLTIDQATEVARSVYFRRRPVELAIRLVSQPAWQKGQSVIDFLLIAELVQKSDIERLGHLETMSPRKLAAILVSAGVIDDSILQIATRLRYFLNQGMITVSQSKSVLKLCRKYKIDVDNVVFNCLPYESSW